MDFRDSCPEISFFFFLGNFTSSSLMYWDNFLFCFFWLDEFLGVETSFFCIHYRNHVIVWEFTIRIIFSLIMLIISVCFIIWLLFERVQKLRDILKTTKLDQKRIYVIKVDLLYLKYRENLTGCRYAYKDSKSKSEISIRAKYLTYFSRIRVFGKSKSNSHSQWFFENL